MVKIDNFEIKTKLNELNYEEYVRVKDWDKIHYAEFLEKLLQIDYDIALEIVDRKLKHKDCIDFENFEDFKRPDFIVIGKTKIKVPENLFKESTGGQIDIFKILLNPIDGYNDEFYKIVPSIVSIYLYPLFYKTKFCSKKYKNLIPLIKKCNFADVLGVCFFLLMNYSKSVSSKTQN